jgi:hypothetical protein
MNLFYGIVTVAIIVVMGYIAYLFSTVDMNRLSEARSNMNGYRIQCEERNNGIYLDRTYQYGKRKGHKFICIKKDAVIQLGD